MIANATVYRGCTAGDNNFDVPGTPENVVTLVGVQIARASANTAVLANIRNTPENPPDEQVKDAYIFICDAGVGSGGFFSSMPIYVTGGARLILNSNVQLYVVLFFNVA